MEIPRFYTLFLFIICGAFFESSLLGYEDDNDRPLNSANIFKEARKDANLALQAYSKIIQEVSALGVPTFVFKNDVVSDQVAPIQENFKKQLGRVLQYVSDIRPFLSGLLKAPLPPSSEEATEEHIQIVLDHLEFLGIYAEQGKQIELEISNAWRQILKTIDAASSSSLFLSMNEILGDLSLGNTQLTQVKNYYMTAVNHNKWAPGTIEEDNWPWNYVYMLSDWRTATAVGVSVSALAYFVSRAIHQARQGGIREGAAAAAAAVLGGVDDLGRLFKENSIRNLLQLGGGSSSTTTASTATKPSVGVAGGDLPLKPGAPSLVINEPINPGHPLPVIINTTTSSASSSSTSPSTGSEQASSSSSGNPSVQLAPPPSRHRRSRSNAGRTPTGTIGRRSGKERSGGSHELFPGMTKQQAQNLIVALQQGLDQLNSPTDSSSSSQTDSPRGHGGLTRSAHNLPSPRSAPVVFDDEEQASPSGPSTPKTTRNKTFGGRGHRRSNSDDGSDSSPRGTGGGASFTGGLHLRPNQFNLGLTLSSPIAAEVFSSSSFSLKRTSQEQPEDGDTPSRSSTIRKNTSRGTIRRLLEENKRRNALREGDPVNNGASSSSTASPTSPEDRWNSFFTPPNQEPPVSPAITIPKEGHDELRRSGHFPKADTPASSSSSDEDNHLNQDSTIETQNKDDDGDFESDQSEDESSSSSSRSSGDEGSQGDDESE